MRMLPPTLIGLFCSVSALHAQTPTLPPTVTAGGMSDITVLSVDIGHFSYGNKIIHVFENSRNQSQYNNSPGKWQFMIEPLLSTVANESGGIDYQTARLDPIERYYKGRSYLYRRARVRLPLDLTTERAIDKAIEVIYARYPEARCKVGPQNVDVLPMTSMQISVSDIEDQRGQFHDNSRLHSKSMYYLTSPSRVFVLFDVWERSTSTNDTDLKEFISFLPFMSINASLSFSVKSTVFNISSIITDKIKDTDLYAKLNGGGSDTYVTRDDLRRLSQSAATQLRAIQIIEDRDSFDEALFRELITGSTTVSADEAFFNSQQGQHTYNSDDLKPSVITDNLKKTFDYDSGKDQWSLSTSASGGGSFLDLVKADFKGSLSTSQMHEFLKKHSLETDIKGNIIVVKSVDLQQVNISHFIQSGSFGTELRNIEKGSPKQGLQTAIYADVVGPISGKSFADLSRDCAGPAAMMLNVR